MLAAVIIGVRTTGGTIVGTGTPFSSASPALWIW